MNYLQYYTYKYAFKRLLNGSRIRKLKLLKKFLQFDSLAKTLAYCIDSFFDSFVEAVKESGK